LAETY